MKTRSTMTFAVGLLTLLALVSTPAQARWGVSIRIGGPGYNRPYYYAPYPYYYAPYPAVIVDPTPVVVQQVPVIQKGPVNQYLGALSDPSEQVRLDAVTQAGAPQGATCCRSTDGYLGLR